MDKKRSGSKINSILHKTFKPSLISGLKEN